MTAASPTSQHTRQRSGSLGLPPPTPLAQRQAPSHQPSPTSPAPSSALSASLKAFADLSLTSPSAAGANPLDTAEFRAAFSHARRTSFGANGNSKEKDGTKDAAREVRPIVIPDGQPAGEVTTPPPGLSTSPSSSSESTAFSLSTPGSSPSFASPPSLVPGHARARSVSNGKVGKPPSASLGGVCEQAELALERGELAISDEDLATPPASGHASGTQSLSGSGIFAGGARWGWPAASAGSSSSAAAAGSAISPPAPEVGVQRRGSFAFASPPSTSSIRAPGSASPGAASSPPANDSLRMMQPLGRVSSAGAALQTPKADAGGGGGGGGKDSGFGIFRRFSISGLGKTRPSAPPTAPPAAAPAPTLAPPVLVESPVTAPVPAASQSQAQSGVQRGRSLTAGANGKPKRRISPMGEKILRGGY
ncbi:hypothetical protein JCM10213_007032 [Rhodosporidiobolus nylandii]